ncbi:MAG: cysteine hydrolase family protein [Peptoniphilus grossensis]
MDALVVIDMQNDFISGSLKGRDTEKLLDKVVEKVEEFKGEIIYTLDTHYEDYLKTKEGENLPIEHCIKGTWGHEIADALKETKSFDRSKKFEKNTFASIELGEYLKSLDEKDGIDSIYFLGLVTDICVVSNALLVKGFLPEKNIYIYKDLTEGLTEEKKAAAISVMESCHIKAI